MAPDLPEIDYEKLTQTLVRTRKQAGLTQQQVADRLGKPQSWVAKVEGGERRLDVIEFIHLARAMDADPLEVLGVLAR